MALVYVVHHLDRNILLLLQEPIRKEFGLSDSKLGMLTGIVYALPFALAGITFGAAEAGAPPGIISILPDTFPRASRPSVMSILFMGPSGVQFGQILIGQRQAGADDEHSGAAIPSIRSVMAAGRQ